MTLTWEDFENGLKESGKLDEFCNLDEENIDAWLKENGFTVTAEQLAALTPKEKLGDSQLDRISGGFKKRSPNMHGHIGGREYKI